MTQRSASMPGGGGMTSGEIRGRGGAYLQSFSGKLEGSERESGCRKKSGWMCKPGPGPRVLDWNGLTCSNSENSAHAKRTNGPNSATLLSFSSPIFLSQKRWVKGESFAVIMESFWISLVLQSRVDSPIAHCEQANKVAAPDLFFIIPCYLL